MVLTFWATFSFAQPLACKQLALCETSHLTASVIKVSSDGTKIVAGFGHSNCIQVWDVQGNKLAEWGKYNWFRGIRDIHITRDNKIIYTTSCDIYIYDMQGHLLAEYNGEGGASRFAVSYDERKIAAVFRDDIHILDFDTATNTLECVGKCVGNKPNGSHKDGVNTLAITRDGTIISSSHDHTLKIWDSAGNLLAKYKNIWELPCTFCLSPDLSAGTLAQEGDTLIVAGFTDGTVRVLDMDGQVVDSLKVTESVAHACCMLQDGNIIFYAGNQIFIWQYRTKHVITCNGHTDTIYKLCITPGDVIVSCSADGTIRSWDLNGNQLAQCNGHTDSVYEMCLSHDSTKIISGSGDKTIRVWQLS